MTLIEEVQQAASAAGANFFGVADLGMVDGGVVARGGSLCAGYPRAVSIGIGLADPLVDRLEELADHVARAVYRYHTHTVVNSALDRCALAVTSRLAAAGYRALPVPASLRTDGEGRAGPVSHKLAAHLAGLGWIGRSCLLVTPERGPRVRWVTVLTDAPLSPTGGPVDPRCEGCHACVDACPVGALTGRAFSPREPREARFDAAACDRYHQELAAAGEPDACGRCVAACPWGRGASRGPVRE
ncbi:MAG TPA: 4Fe-4S dicluster domain-containing protein [Methanoregulaceae archaeon]|nr:4Fe-4S dicluster domain-containing protein [Methanoregulaceae archaeon]HQJ88350.1 4Fe-4S dicluster domain-containing protein [Methanoregulaceae archaeon]